MLSSATRIARYVVPQTTQTEIHARYAARGGWVVTTHLLSYAVWGNCLCDTGESSSATRIMFFPSCFAR
jgi:hypothetical protein